MSTISTSGTLTYSSGTFSYTGSFSSGNANTWPITVNAGLTVTFGSTLTMSVNTRYFIVGGANVTIDGGNYTMTINPATNDYEGLVRNGSDSVNGFAGCAVRNVVAVNSETNDINACIAQNYFCKGQTNCTITNCSVTTTRDINSSQGAIAGIFNCAAISNCYAITGTILNDSGGIVGRWNQSSGAIANSYVIIYGNMNDNAGGIVGSLNTGASITNCYVIMSGYMNSNTGGIVAVASTNTTVTNCYFIISGNMNTDSAGIMSRSSTSAVIRNCYVIVGGTIQSSSAGVLGSVTSGGVVSNCYLLVGTLQGGAYAMIGTNSGTTTDCYYSVTNGSSSTFSNGGTVTNCSSSSGNAKWTLTGANWALNSYNSGAAWYNYDSNNLTPYVLSAFSTAVALSTTVEYTSAQSGTVGLTSYGSSLSNGIVSSTQGGTWTYSSSGIAYSGISRSTSYPLDIYAYNVLSSLTRTFTFTNATAIKNAYNSTVTNVNTIVPYMYSETNDVIITSTVCFLEGSEILTMRGYVKIEELNKDDLIKTNLHGFKKIYKLGRSEMINLGVEERIKDQLYVCGKEEFKINKDLIITGCHSILVDSFENEEQKEATRKLLGNIYVTCEKYRLPACLDSRCKVFEEKGKHRIYHITLENESELLSYGIYANGLLVESCSKYTMDRDFDDRNVLIDIRK